MHKSDMLRVTEKLAGIAGPVIGAQNLLGPPSPFHLRRDHTMFGAAVPYLVALSAMLLAGLSALTLIYTLEHLDPPEAPSLPEQIHADEKVAV